MIRDITIGQYYPVDSLIHRLDPRAKLIGTLLYIITLFLFGTSHFIRSLCGYAFAAVVLFTVIKVSRVPFRFILRGLKPVLFLLMFTVVFNIFLTPGEELFRWGMIRITQEGLKTAVLMGIRLVLLILGSSLMTFTTTPNQLTDGLERLLGPLKKIRVPVHEISMMMSIALRFIPILLEETDKIMKAQQARGADFETGNIMKRAKAMVPILVPLFVSAFRRAGDLAMAMEARCYRGGAGRTKMKPLIYQKRDYAAFGCFVLYLTIIIVLKQLVA